MKKLLLFLTFWLVLTGVSYAQLTMTTVSGTIYQPNGAVAPNVEVTVVRSYVSGQVVSIFPVVYITDANGAISFSVPRGGTSCIYAPTIGLRENGESGVCLAIPNAATASLAALVPPVNGLILQDEGIALSGYYTTLNFVGAGVTAVQASAGNATITIAGGGSSTLTVGTTAITSGSPTRILYDNAGVLGEYAITGNGSVAMGTSPQFTTGIGIGGAAGTGNSLKLYGTTSGAVTIVTPATTTPYNLTLPSAAPGFTQCLQIDSSGIVTATGSACGGGGGSPGGAVGTLQYNNAGSFGGVTSTSVSGASITFGAGDFDFSAGTSLKVPVSAAPAPTVSGRIAYNTTAHQFEGGVNGSNLVFTMLGNTTSGSGSTIVLANTPTLTTPIIGSFVNATHTHQNAAGGGALDVASITSGAFAKARQNATTVYTDQANTYSTGAQDFASATSLKPPTSAGAAPTTSGLIAYDSTSNTLEYGENGTNRTVANLDGTQTLSGKTLTTPTIASFVNATHTHINAVGGGTLDAAAIASGTLTRGVGGTGSSASTTDGQLLIGNTATGNWSVNTITAGSNVTVTNGNGTITISASSSAGSRWDQLSNPTSNLALTMGSFTTTMTYGSSTGAGNMWTDTDTASNTGTGYVHAIQTAASSAAKPLSVTAGGASNGVEMTTAGILQALGTGGFNATSLVSGTVADGRLSANVPLLNAANVFSSATGQSVKKLLLPGSTSGTLTVLAAAIAGTTTITLPGGTTDFSATGGTSQVVKQTSAGGAFTVAQLASSDISGNLVTSIATTSPITGGTITSTGTIACATCVTSAAALTSNAVVLGAGSQATKVVAGIITDGTAQISLGVNTTTLGSVKLFGNTSGDATVQPAAIAGTSTVVTLPNASSTLPIFGQQITFTGPTAARSIALPDAAFTVARTDAANTFTGASSTTSWAETTPVITGGLTASGSGANTFAGSTGTFLTSTGAVTIGPGAVTVSGITSFTPPARSSGVAPYLRLQAAADTAQTVDTEFPGIIFGGDSSAATVTRQGADGTTIALQREYRFVGPTYAFAGATTITDVFSVYASPPIVGTSATFTRNHTLGIVDSTSAASSITGGLIVATTLGTTATSVGIGGGNVNAGGTVTADIATITTSGTVAGSSIMTLTATQTASAKHFTPQEQTVSSSATVTPVSITNDIVTITAQAAGLTVAAPTGTPTQGDRLTIRIKDNGTARAITWNAIYRAGTTVALPTTTTISKTLYVLFVYNSTDVKWDFLAYADGF